MNAPAIYQTDFPKLDDTETVGEALQRMLADLVVAGLAERAGVTFRFVEFLKVAFPLMLISIVFSHAYLYYRYL